ncbi:MAG: glycosyltransferase family 1 protein [Chitinophagales bacterium]|nr:glycosyltransferase family 1 protein [Chitinophagales bacterium]
MINSFEQLPLLCFSHLRWDFVYQRPQHLLSRFALHQPVFYIEESICDSDHNYFETYHRGDNLKIIVPHIVKEATVEDSLAIQRDLLDEWMEKEIEDKYLLWYYTPAALAFTKHLSPEIIIYDCMDELSAFLHAPAELKALENELFDRADIVFTGGKSLFESKRKKHSNVYLFPSSVDSEHFKHARAINQEPADQIKISEPKAGFAGVIDERMDLHLLKDLADKCPEWNFIMIGPVVKIDVEALPKAPNLHYLGMKTYNELPAYMSGWKFGLLPFALNKSTAFISPTKTPEYLAAGLEVISTPIQDVVNIYGKKRLVYIATNGEEFKDFLNKELSLKESETWKNEIEILLEENSWNGTWEKMNDIIYKKEIFKTTKTELHEI